MHGILAVNKPKGKTSAQVLEEVKTIFTKSELFKASLEKQRQVFEKNDGRQKKYRKMPNKWKTVKMGHGGTLDPMATGVLIIGVGKGTKLLHRFLSCIKTYEATALLGTSTDTYDADGKILHRAPHGHITQKLVEDALTAFRGEIDQMPPLYSALSMDGKRLYDYAREGKPLPRPIEKRRVNISQLDLLEFTQSHSYMAPSEETTAEQKAAEYMIRGDHMKEIVAAKARQIATIGEDAIEPADDQVERTDVPQKRHVEGDQDGADAVPKRSKTKESIDGGDDARIAATKAPLIRIMCQTSSGTYVRSLIHDIGIKVNSAAHLVALVRRTQGEFELGKNVIEWDDLQNNRWQDQAISQLSKDSIEDGDPE